MRAITSEILDAFMAGKSRTIKNTSTDGVTLFLHGNAIAKKDGGTLLVTLAGWNTPTTRERVNAVLSAYGVPGGFCQRNHEPKFYRGGRTFDVDTRQWYSEDELRAMGA